MTPEPDLPHPVSPDLQARLALALRAILRNERSEVSAAMLIREFTREARAQGLPPEQAVLAFKEALGAPPVGALEARYVAVRERLIAQCIRSYYEPVDVAPAAADGAPAEPNDGRPYVALVEDDPTMAAILAHVLAEYRVRQFDDARRALAAFYGERPDLVIFDLHLPDYSGRTLLSTLRGDARLRGVPAIVVTGDPDPELEQTLRQEGFGAYFVKPLRETAPLLRAVRELLAARRP